MWCLRTYCCYGQILVNSYKKLADALLYFVRNSHGDTGLGNFARFKKLPLMRGCSLGILDIGSNGYANKEKVAVCMKGNVWKEREYNGSFLFISLDRCSRDGLHALTTLHGVQVLNGRLDTEVVLWLRFIPAAQWRREQSTVKHWFHPPHEML